MEENRKARKIYAFISRFNGSRQESDVVNEILTWISARIVLFRHFPIHGVLRCITEYRCRVLVL